MIGRVARHMLPHLSGVPHLHVNRPLFKRMVEQIGNLRALAGICEFHYSYFLEVFIKRKCTSQSFMTI